MKITCTSCGDVSSIFGSAPKDKSQCPVCGEGRLTVSRGKQERPLHYAKRASRTRRKWTIPEEMFIYKLLNDPRFEEKDELEQTRHKDYLAWLQWKRIQRADIILPCMSCGEERSAAELIRWTGYRVKDVCECGLEAVVDKDGRPQWCCLKEYRKWRRKLGTRNCAVLCPSCFTGVVTHRRSLADLEPENLDDTAWFRFVPFTDEERRKKKAEYMRKYRARMRRKNQCGPSS